MRVDKPVPAVPSYSYQTKQEAHVYKKPKLVRYGTFRELTLAGLFQPDGDGFVLPGPIAGLIGDEGNGCDIDPLGRCRS